MIDAMENAGQLPQFHLDSDRLINGFEAEATSEVHNNLSRDLGPQLTLHDHLSSVNDPFEESYCGMLRSEAIYCRFTRIGDTQTPH